MGGSAAEVRMPLTSLIQNPMDLTCSYRGFLDIAHPYDWSGVGDVLVWGLAIIHFWDTMPVCAQSDGDLPRASVQVWQMWT